jgi:hypothetical protein
VYPLGRSIPIGNILTLTIRKGALSWRTFSPAAAAKL